MSSYAAAAAHASFRRSRTTNLILVLITAVVSLLLAEQVAAGWIALGERANLSRREFNLAEIVVIAGAGLWGLYALWTGLSLLRQRENYGIREYFDDNANRPTSLSFTTAVLGATGVICLLIAVQVATGWLALGERVNISRRDLNFLEIGTILLGLFWSGLCLRTVLGIIRRERPAWSWAQWGLFISALTGGIILLSGVFDIPGIIPRGGTIADNPATTLLLAVPGLIILLSALVGYRLITQDYGDPMLQKSISGSIGERARARDISSARLPAGQSIRNQLAKSPGAGAIIGFVALFVFFSVATDLFLQPQSLAGALTNNITRGIIAIGATMLMISGEFDLSVGSLLGIGGLTFLGLITAQLTFGLLLAMLSIPVTCWVIGAFLDGRSVRALIVGVGWYAFVLVAGTATGWQLPPLDPVISAVGAMLVCIGFGYMNGFLLIRTGIPSFIVTLSTLLMLRGIPLVLIAGGKTLRYVDYYNEPPFIAISRILLIILAVVFIGGLGLIGQSVIRGLWAGFRNRLDTYDRNPSDFRTLALIFHGLYLAALVVIVVGGIVLLAGTILDQISQLSQGSPFLQISFFDILNGRIGSLPLIGEISREINLRIGVLWWLVLVVIFQFILQQTRYGNATFAVGGNAGAARAQGINVNRIKISNYMLVAVLVGIAALLDASRLQSIDALRGTGLELEVIAATVIGGALLSGGYGSIIGALLGVFIFGMMQTGLVLIGVDARLFDAIIGAIILIAVVINSWSRRIKT
jgi:ribose/xylose/arabinose/galactoside ABC-type transport system permease subunit